MSRRLKVGDHEQRFKAHARNGSSRHGQIPSEFRSPTQLLHLNVSSPELVLTLRINVNSLVSLVLYTSPYTHCVYSMFVVASTYT